MPDSTAIRSHLLRGEYACPHCGNNVLEAVSDGTQTNFLCRQCWTCWHIELGYMAPVPVLTCPGCPYKQECLRHRDMRADATGTLDEAASGVEAGMADVVMVSPDAERAARLALAAGESLTPESLEELAEGVPPAAEELVHEESSLQEVLLDEGEPFELPSDDDVEAAWANANESDLQARTGWAASSRQ